MDINGIKTSVLIQYWLWLGEPESPFLSPSTLKGPEQVCSIYFSLEKFKKLEDRDYNEKTWPAIAWGNS